MENMDIFTTLENYARESQFHQITLRGYRQLLTLMEESLVGHEKDVEAQYEALKAAVAVLPEDIYLETRAAYDTLRGYFYDSSEFQKLHYGRGGIVRTGDDGFYMDFAAWLIGRGEPVLNAFFTEGAPVIIRYIKDHDIPESEYTWECLGYVFNRDLDAFIKTITN